MIRLEPKERTQILGPLSLTSGESGPGCLARTAEVARHSSGPRRLLVYGETHQAIGRVAVIRSERETLVADVEDDLLQIGPLDSRSRRR